MFTELNVKSRTLAYGDFRVDEVYLDEATEFWLYHKNYGVKSLMYGWAVSNGDSEEVMMQILEANIDSYIEYYREDYEDGYKEYCEEINDLAERLAQAWKDIDQWDFADAFDSMDDAVAQAKHDIQTDSESVSSWLTESLECLEEDDTLYEDIAALIQDVSDFINE